MYRVRCPNCDTRIKLNEKLFGRKVSCKCGHVLRMPNAPGADADDGHSSSILFSCSSCGRKLKVPADSAGKLSKCPCGAKCQVPTPVQLEQTEPLVATAVEPVDDLWADFEPAAEDPFAAQSYQQQTPAFSGPAYTAPAYQSQSVGNKTKRSRGNRKDGNTIGLIGFIISLVSLSLCGLLSPISGILSLIGMFREPKGLAIAGFIVSCISGLAMVGLLLLFIPAFSVVVKHGETAIAAAEVQNFYIQNERLPSKAEFAEITGELSESIEYDTWQVDEFRLSHHGFDGSFGTSDDIVKEFVFDENSGEFLPRY